MKRINIMTSCDDRLALYILPQMASMAENLRAYRVDLFLLHCRIEPENIATLKAFAEKFENLTFHEIFVEDVDAFAELAKSGGGWAYEAYFSLCCHEYLPEDVDRVLYIDAGDVIVNGDFAEYYFADFEGRSLIATLGRLKSGPDGGATVYEKDDLHNPEHLPGILRGLLNSGSYVIDVERFRANRVTVRDFLDVARFLCEKLPDAQPVYFGDQGLISAAFVGDIKYFAYPEIKNVWYMPYNFCLWFFDRADELWYAPKIIHYAGVNFKPWQARLSVNELKKYRFQAELDNVYAPFHMKYKQLAFYEIWWDYCKTTPIHEKANAAASVYARALEEHFLPLCKRYNELVDGNIALQNRLQTQKQLSIARSKKPHKKKR
jgi:lipopolysaccharide biosynthesis glycosyltransferase